MKILGQEVDLEAMTIDQLEELGTRIDGVKDNLRLQAIAVRDTRQAKVEARDLQAKLTKAGLTDDETEKVIQARRINVPVITATGDAKTPTAK